MNPNKKKIMIGVVAVVLVLAVGIGVYAGSKYSKIKKTDLKDKNLEVSGKVEKELGDDYLNIAILGTKQKDKEEGAVDSDAVYVASLNKETKEIKLMQVYGNTIMEQGKKTIKMKEAYADGGAEKAISVLNENLDLNIKDYVSIDFKAMADTIDILAGIEIDVTEEEIPHIDGYTQEIAGILGKEPVKIAGAGLQTLDGTQAAAYCRIRVTEGGDVKRGSRQQEVIGKILEKLQSADFSQMDQIMDAVFPQVETNFKLNEMVSYGKDAASYKLTIVPAFPREIKEQKRNEVSSDVQFTDYEEVVEATDFKSDVKQIHAELFPDKKYQADGNGK